MATTTIPSAPKGKRHASEGSAAEAAPPDTGWRDLALFEFSVSNPTIPIPFHELLEVVAVVDRDDAQTRQLLEHIAKEKYEIELSDNYERDASEDADVGAFAMSPKDAYEALVANEVDYVPLEEIKGRIAATLALIYPPGIGVVLPGERWDDRAQPMLDYFMAFQESFNRFPGFNYEVQGVYQERIDDRIKFYTYAVRH